MSDLLAELRSKWEQALASGTSGREWRAIVLSTTSPVKLLAGIRDRDDRISLLIETPIAHAPRHRVRFQAEGISLIDERLAAERSVRLALTLERGDLRDVFEVLVIDLIAVAAGARSPDLAIQQTARRLEAWQVCLRVRQRGLTREEQAGLLGELAVMERVAAEIGPPRAVRAWLGPVSGIHDFEGAGLAIEVKATVGPSHYIRISHLDQLDSTGLAGLILVRARFQEAADGRTLPEAVSAVRASLVKDHPSASAEFDEKLMRAGYLDADAEVYASMRTWMQELQGFDVSDTFPRLVRAMVPPAIVDAAYSLDERYLRPFLLDDGNLRAMLQRMNDVPR
jgi:hypothetical protein